MARDQLHYLTTNALICGLPEPLKAEIDAALSKRATREEVWELASLHAERGSLTFLGIHAYLYPERERLP